jgi:eukaryotic-like serine/threonine-protein kinase
MSELLGRLQAALGSQYRIESELGGGGMSRVFLAEEIELGRRVVIKVLPPDMAAGVNKERFQREIKLAARLQHPHIVPLLTAGAAASDLLYYVMPYIEGESLRAKLAREGELPIGEVVRILREVTDALAYAHRQQVVHRDIKPDNVLLAEGHAVVTDFGVAKAVSASSGGTHSSLTSMGVALGTPAYMSPEQAAADPHVDHRADIYAVGALAYEMLTGRPPFTGTTPQQVLAAHVSQTPEPVTQHRETIPPVLADVVMRCLAKRAADRWQTSDALRAEFEAVATPSSGGITPTATQPVPATAPTALGASHHPIRVAALFGGAAAAVLVLVYALMIGLGLPDWVFVAAIALLAVGLPIILATNYQERQRAAAATTGLHLTTPVGLEKHLTWRKAITGGGLAFAGLTAVVGGYMGMRSLGIGPVGTLMATGTLGDRELVILAVFENRTPDSTLGATVTDLLGISLSESPSIRIADQARLSESLARMQLDPGTRIDEAIAREIAERENIKAVIAGDVGPLGSGFVVSGRLISAKGEILTAQQASAADASGLIVAVDELSAKLRERIGESLRSIRRTLPLELVTTGSLRALRLYTQATQAEISGDDDRAVQLLDEAVRIDSGFAMAYRKIGTILSNNFEQRDRVINALTKAYQLRDRLTELERGYAAAQYHMNVTGRRDEALAAYRTILEKRPDDHRALNNSGVLYSQLGQNDRAAEFYERALAMDSTWSSGFTNLAFVRMTLGQFEEADRVLAVMETRFPGNPRLDEYRGFLALAQRDFDGAERSWTRLRVAQRGNLGWEAQTAEHLAFLAATRGGYRAGEQLLNDAIVAYEQRGALAERERVVAYWDANRILFLPGARLGDRFRSVSSNEALAALAVPDRDYEAAIVPYLFVGDTARARALLGEMRRSGQPDLGLDFQRGYDRADGLVDIAMGNTQQGLAKVRRGVEGWGCAPCETGVLAQAYDLAGRPDSAAVYWKAYLHTTWGLPDSDSWALPMAYRRLGEISEARGRRDDAVEYYNQFVSLWEHADPELQPQVREIRNRISKLVGERG